LHTIENLKKKISDQIVKDASMVRSVRVDV